MHQKKAIGIIPYLRAFCLAVPGLDAELMSDGCVGELRDESIFDLFPFP